MQTLHRRKRSKSRCSISSAQAVYALLCPPDVTWHEDVQRGISGTFFSDILWFMKCSELLSPAPVSSQMLAEEIPAGTMFTCGLCPLQWLLCHPHQVK